MLRNSLALVLMACLILVSCSAQDEPPETLDDGPVVVISENQD